MSEADQEYGPFIAVKWTGRSNGVLHVDRACVYIVSKGDDELVWGPRDRFDPDQELCRRCGGEDA